MTLKMKLLPALVAAMAAMAAGCGGGGSGAGTEPSGKTLLTPVALLSATSLCVDQNSNWQCDDGDRNGASTVATAQGLSNAGMPHVSGSAYTLLEQRDAVNLRTQLWVSEAGSSTVTALSTLRSRLATQGKSLAQINAMAATLSAAYGTGLEALLGTGFKAALPMRATAIDALDAYSLAVFNALSANAVLPAYTPTMGSATTDATWDSDTVDQRRQLSAQSSVVLNNSDGNRLYLFDAAQPSVSSRELDLIPPALPVMAGYPSLLRQSVAWLGKAVSVLVDTASAATALVGAPTPGSPVVLPPGKGIAGIQLVDGGNTAYVLMNMLSGVYTQSGCLGTTDGNEGLFKVSLTDAASTRFLSQSPACIHSGFSLMAADAKGLALAAWDATGQRLWLINGNTMVRKGSIDLKFDPNKPPQAMAMTPGGHYLAVAGDGRITLIDVDNARIVTQQSGDCLTWRKSLLPTADAAC